MPKTPIKIFIAYSRKDEQLKNELLISLNVLLKNKSAEIWHDGAIEAGKNWKEEINTHLRKADLILLLVSKHFIASDYAYNTELDIALKRQALGEVEVIPIILKPCAWKHAPKISALQVMPKDGKPVTKWADHDDAFNDVTERIIQKVKAFRKNRFARMEAAKQAILEDFQRRKKEEETAKREEWIALEKRKKEAEEAERLKRRLLERQKSAEELAKTAARAKLIQHNDFKLSIRQGEAAFKQEEWGKAITAYGIALGLFQNDFIPSQQSIREQISICKKEQRKWMKNLRYVPLLLLFLVLIWGGKELISQLKSVSPIKAQIEKNMVFIQGGDFMMGCQEGDEDCWDSEKPPHKVSLNSYHLNKYEVTNEEFAAFLNKKQYQNKGNVEWIDLSGSYKSEKCRISQTNGEFVVEKGYESHPVIYVSWYGAEAFCSWLGWKYQLPTEAQWEFAARGGIKTKNYKYSGSNSLEEVGWYYKNSGEKVYQVGKEKLRNELGLYGMSGNVREWCQDWYSEYLLEDQVEPSGAKKGNYKIVRGGSWYGVARYCHSSVRSVNAPDLCYSYIGFRVVKLL